MGKSNHLLTHLLQMTVKLLHWSGVIGLIIGFDSYHFSQVRNKRTIFKTRSLRTAFSLVKNNRAAPILQLNLVILATLKEYYISFLY